MSRAQQHIYRSLHHISSPKKTIEYLQVRCNIIIENMKFIRANGRYEAAESPLPALELAWREMTGEVPVVAVESKLYEPSDLIRGISDKTWEDIRSRKLQREDAEVYED